MALSVGWLVGRLVGLQNILKNSKSRFCEYVAVVCTLINTLLIIVLYRQAGGQSVGWPVGWSVGSLVGRSVFKIFWKTQNRGFEII